MYSPNNTVSPFNTQTNLGDLTEYHNQASLNQVIIILLINTKPVLCLNRARLKPGYQRQNHSSHVVTVDHGTQVNVVDLPPWVCVSYGTWQTCPSSFRPTQKHPSLADKMTACGCPSDRTAFSSFIGKTASQAQNKVDHFNIHTAQQGGGAKPCQVNQSKHPHLSVPRRRTKKKSCLDVNS